MSSRKVTRKPRGLRRVERWAVGMVMAIVAIVLERVVMRSVKRGGKEVVVPEPTTLTSKGGEVDLPG